MAPWLPSRLVQEYVSLRLSQGYDPAYLSQLFDFLVHLISQLQAPARQAGTQVCSVSRAQGGLLSCLTVSRRPRG